jgi:hypothetical protein
MPHVSLRIDRRLKLQKKIFLTCFLSVITVLCFVFRVPAFAGMERVDEAELARTNASVTGASIKDRNHCVEKDGICSETKQDSINSYKETGVSFPAESNTTEFIGLSLSIGGKEAFEFGMSGGGYSNRMGGTITSVQSR